MTPAKLLPLLFAAASAFATEYAVGDTAPNFSAKDQFGRTHSLYDYQGKIVVLDFCATWCGPCQQANRDIRHLLQVMQAARINVVYLPAIIQNAQVEPTTAADAEQWQISTGAATPVLHVDGHTGSELAQNFTAFSNAALPAGLAFPTYVIFDAQSKVKVIHKGALFGDELKARIAAVAGVATPSTHVESMDYAPSAISASLRLSNTSVNGSPFPAETQLPVPDFHGNVHVTTTTAGNILSSSVTFTLNSEDSPAIATGQPFAISVRPTVYTVKAYRTLKHAYLTVYDPNPLGNLLFNDELPATVENGVPTLRLPALNSLASMPSAVGRVEVRFEFAPVLPYRTYTEVRALFLSAGSGGSMNVVLPRLDQVEAAIVAFRPAAARPTATSLLASVRVLKPFIPSSIYPELEEKLELLVAALSY